MRYFAHVKFCLLPAHTRLVSRGKVPRAVLHNRVCVRHVLNSSQPDNCGASTVRAMNGFEHPGVVITDEACCSQPCPLDPKLRTSVSKGCPYRFLTAAKMSNCSCQLWLRLDAIIAGRPLAALPLRPNSTQPLSPCFCFLRMVWCCHRFASFCSSFAQSGTANHLRLCLRLIDTIN